MCLLFLLATFLAGGARLTAGFLGADALQGPGGVVALAAAAATNSDLLQRPGGSILVNALEVMDDHDVVAKSSDMWIFLVESVQPQQPQQLLLPAPASTDRWVEAPRAVEYGATLKKLFIMVDAQMGQMQQARGDDDPVSVLCTKALSALKRDEALQHIISRPFDSFSETEKSVAAAVVPKMLLLAPYYAGAAAE
ncbi:hypothetical protein B484DRAFT_391756 [Ochromonadaceae sp. CCMP2298]|nr:hypothetical protein B484DRAFT_391756 [Ochromonadaceae sp. CCMP2298]